MMFGQKLLLQVCLLIVGLTAGTLCVRNVVDHTKLIADRPKHAYKPSSHSDSWKNKQQGSVPPYAVQMEPVAHYSQQDPLYANNVSQSASPKIDFNVHPGGSDFGVPSEYGLPPPPPPQQPHLVYGAPYQQQPQHHHQQQDYYKEPEPIIEIIIKESNESLPAPPTPPPAPVTKRPKEPVQVFYVKYKKNPNSYGDKEDDIVYEPPVPAITPPSSEVDGESETTFSTESSSPHLYNYVTAGPPPPSTTYRTIIKPDSEVYHGSSLRVTFGKPEENWGANEAQNRDSISEASDVQNKVKKTADQEFKRSLVSPAPEFQRHNNNFNGPQPTNQPQFDGFPKTVNFDHPQQQSRKPNPQQFQNYFREDNLRPNFQGQIPILNQQFKPQQNNFESIDNFRNLQPNYQQFNNQPNVQQFPNQQSHQQIIDQQNHPQFNNHQNHQQLINQQLNNQQNHQQFVNQQRQPDLQPIPPPRNQANFQDRPPAHIKPNNERPFSSKPFENRPSPQGKPFENRQPQDRPPFESRPFDSRLFENRPGPERFFENRPFENRPFENLPPQSKPFETRPLYDRPFENHGPVQNRPIENRPAVQDRPFDPNNNNRQNQGTVNYRPSKPPTPQNIPLNPNPSFVPSDRRPTVQPLPQVPSNYNNQPIGTKHTVDLAFPPQHQQQQFQQPFQHQYRPADSRPVNGNPVQQQQQQFTTEVNSPPISQYKHQPQQQQQFIPESMKTSLISQFQITPSTGFKLEPKQEQSPQQKQQPSRYAENPNNNRYSTQTEQNSFRIDDNPWQISNQPNQGGAFKPHHPAPEYKEHSSASTVQNAIADTTSGKSFSKTTEKPYARERSTTTPTSTTTTVVIPKKTTSELAATAKNETKKPNFKNFASLPDEVPDELREQLLSSGILSNADIQILDYDKVGDIPIENLPPEALENLYGQGSDPVPSVVLPPNGTDVQMKVVQYDPSTEEGRKVESSYVDRPKAQTLDPVVLNDEGYNRFLPLNINGTHFPIPNSPLLANKSIGSVVILSPVGYDLSDDQSRSSRNTAVPVKGVHFVVGDVVKDLVKNPSRENYEIWLKKEKSTPSDEQSVVLLVTKPNNNKSSNNKDKEIYMYDATHDRVSKLSGELSATFVDVAESNSQSHDLDNLSSEEEVDVLVPGNGDAPVISGYVKTDDSLPSSIVATVANN